MNVKPFDGANAESRSLEAVVVVATVPFVDVEDVAVLVEFELLSVVVPLPAAAAAAGLGETATAAGFANTQLSAAGLKRFVKVNCTSCVHATGTSTVP